MTKLAAILAAAAASTVLAGSAQAHDWGGGTCVGYGCVRDLDDDGLRPVRGYRRVEHYEERPAVRVIERRSYRVYRDDDLDDDDED